MDLYLRPILPSDLDVLFAQGADPVAVHMAAFTAKDPTDRPAFDAHWARILASPTGLNRIIVADGEIAGSVQSYEDEGHPEVTYWLGREFWGRGIATTALAAFLREETARPIYARAAADNAASLRVLQKCGFSIIGQDRGFANARGSEIDEYLLVLESEIIRPA